MRAMVLKCTLRLTADALPLELMDMPQPETEQDEIRIRITACGICHTKLDEIEGRTPP